MIFEYSSNSENGYIYLNNSENIIENNYKIVYKENYKNLTIYRIKKIHLYKSEYSFDLTKLDFRCKCGLKINFVSKNLMPSEGWQELVDLWSCHNMEFRSMLDLKPKPRKNSVLLSNFYFLANANDFCCLNLDLNKIFYNEIFDFKNCLKIVFHHFKTFFMHNNRYQFVYDNFLYEVMIFEDVFIENGEYKGEAIKVGYKSIKKCELVSENINEYFCKLIYKILVDNEIEILVRSYKLSYIHP
ncbi:hypothetical protein GVAV_000007 [Gurleya vavrai]